MIMYKENRNIAESYAYLKFYSYFIEI